MSSVWEIKRGPYTGSSGYMFFHATKDGRYIELGKVPYDVPPFRVRQIDRIGFLAQFMKFRVRMSTSKKDADFEITPQVPSGYIISPEVASISLVKAHLKVEVFGVFSAQYKNAWTDTDLKNKIIGFVEIASGFDSKDEEQIVWLVGTLGTLGHPFFDHGC